MEINIKGLISKAEELSRYKFLQFANGIYELDKEKKEDIESLMRVPIILPYEIETLLPDTMAEEKKQEFLELFYIFTDNALGCKEAVLIDFNGLLNTEGIEEFLEENRENPKSETAKNFRETLRALQEKYPYFILYNEGILEEDIQDMLEDNEELENKKTEEELETIIVDYISIRINHERCHIIAEYREEEGVVLTNGATLDSEDIISMINNTGMRLNDADEVIALSNDTNEAFIDTLNSMMYTYEDGDTIEDCLYKVIKKREEEGLQYRDIDDREVLILYALFPDELAEWALFGAYDTERRNLLQEKRQKVFGETNVFRLGRMKEQVKSYCEQLGKNEISEKQREMISMLLGPIIERKVEGNIKREDFREAALKGMPWIQNLAGFDILKTADKSEKGEEK